MFGKPQILIWTTMSDTSKKLFSCKNPDDPQCSMFCPQFDNCKEKEKRRINMSQLIPENTTRKLDALGRITLPKGLRDRMFLSDNAELELFTANIDGRQCICLSKPITEEEEIQQAVDFLVGKGYLIEKEG